MPCSNVETMKIAFYGMINTKTASIKFSTKSIKLEWKKSISANLKNTLINLGQLGFRYYARNTYWLCL